MIPTFEALLDAVRALESIEQEEKAQRLTPPHGLNRANPETKGRAATLEAGLAAARTRATAIGRADLLQLLDRLEQSALAKLFERQGRPFDGGAVTRFSADVSELRRAIQRAPTRSTSAPQVQPTDRATVLRFLRAQSPALVVHEVTATNETDMRRVWPNAMAGHVVWEIRRDGARVAAFGVLWSSAGDLSPYEGLQRPLQISILQAATPSAPGGTQLRQGEAIVDAHDHVWLRVPPDGAPTSIVHE